MKNPLRVIAMYLPQFHQIPENDEWWGEGYTEWTAVKKTKSYFEKQIQPRVPLNENYYDLSQKKTMIWQESLMKKYNIYGLCFYHYYFKNGRRILEKPAENLLKWTDIDIPFCFSWANETWARSWSNVANSNTWNLKEKVNKTERDRGILLYQSYGFENEWKEHFDYLYPFFKDDRYIKIDGHPVFLIYKPDQIPGLPRMMDYWKTLSKQCNIEYPIVIGTNTQRNIFEKKLQQEPNYTDLGKCFNHANFSDVVNAMVENARIADEKTFLCASPGYDDTPRRGEKGEEFKIAPPEEFCKQMAVLIQESKCKGNEFLFLNAWNEWGEGMYIEPDTVFQYGYLEAVKKALSFNNSIEQKKSDHYVLRREIECKKMLYKSETSERTLKKMIQIKSNGLSIKKFFSYHNIRAIVVYGKGLMAEWVIKELQEEVAIKAIMDRNTDVMLNFDLIRVIAPNELTDNIDAIVVTAVGSYDEIYYALKKKYDVPIFNFEEIADYILDCDA